MSSEYQPKFEQNLAGAAELEEIDVEKAEPTHNPAESLKAGLARLYEKHLIEINKQLHAGSIDKTEANKLTARVDQLSQADLGYEVSKQTPIDIAREIMREYSFFGLEEIKNTCIELKEEIPIVPFSSAELEQAFKLGQILIYRTDSTMKELIETVGPELGMDESVLCLSYYFTYEDKDYYHSQRIQPGWALVSKTITTTTPEMDYADQDELISELLVDEVYRNRSLPPEYQEAINEFFAQEKLLYTLLKHNVKSDIKRAWEIISNLKINKYLRQTPAEFTYDSMVYYQNTGMALCDGDLVCTSAHVPEEGFVIMRNYSSGILELLIGDLDHRLPAGLGFAISRRGSDLKS